MSQALERLKPNFNHFKYNKYTSLYPFNDAQAFARWLTENQLSMTEFENLFDGSNTPTINIDNNPWIEYLKHQYEPDHNTQYNNLFCHLADFIVAKAKSDWQIKINKAGFEPHPQIDLAAQLQVFERELLTQFITVITPTLTLELNVARVSGRLQGNSHEQRFKDFIQSLKNKVYVLEIFTEYPLLLKQLITITENHLNQHIEFLTRLHHDIEVLNQTFGYLGQFNGFNDETGDLHNLGRAVRVCLFSHNKIVYKPRSLKVDLAFNQLLTALNKAAQTQFKTHESLNFDSHGWSEYIAYQATQTSQESSLYYHRMGNYLALLYVLNSGDFHHENIIAAGEHPMLIDLESIFHVNFSNITNEQCDEPSLTDALHTVLDAMILPHKTQFAGQKLGLDVSALGHRKNQSVHLQVGQIVNMARDDMHFESQETYTELTTSKPDIETQYQLADQHITKQLIKGFSELYDFFTAQPQWLDQSPAYKQMCQQMYRSILRPTDTYQQLIRCLQHPDQLRAAIDRDLFLEEKLWVMTKTMGHLRRTARYEAMSIKDNDVPIFYFRPDSVDLFTGCGHVIKNYFHHTQQARIANTIKQLSDEDKKAQIWLIKATMETQNIPIKTKPVQINGMQKVSTNADDFCHSITAELLGCAHQRGQLLHWNNLEILNETQWTINSRKEFELFDGNLGSLLYLNCYSAAYKNKSLAEMVLYTIENLCQKIPFIYLNHIGGFVGWGGVLYSLAHINANHDSEVIKRTLVDLSQRIIKQINEDNSFDVLHGAAGCLLAAISVHKTWKRDCFLDLAAACAKHLRDNFVVLPEGGAWPNHISDADHLGGFSHGATGIGYALAVFDAYINKPIHAHII